MRLQQKMNELLAQENLSAAETQTRWDALEKVDFSGADPGAAPWRLGRR